MSYHKSSPKGWRRSAMLTRLALVVWCLHFVLAPTPVCAQAGYDLPLKKPVAFEDKSLASEKSTATKNTMLRRFVQGTVTHYNYYFNAHQKILQVLNRSRSEHRDDLTDLVSFHSYSLDDTKKERLQLDSVIYKCTAGIVLHDLRNGWIDNLYLLIGQAYLLEMKFDSADRILEFLNYHFYVKEKGDYHIAIGTSTQSKDGQISISNPENRSIFHEAFNRPPSRNDGLIWQVRSYIEQGKYAQASGLISLLKTDPLFPPRLIPALCEQEAFWFYRQEAWDSTTIYLQRALPNADNNQELARWEYLLGQLCTRTHQPAAAEVWYTKAIEHNTDPRIDIYARLYRALLGQGDAKEEIPKTIAALLKLAGKDRFAPFRDILYLSAARLALQLPDTTKALGFLAQATQTGGNPHIKNQAFLLMSDLGKAQGNYKIVATAYDSLELGDPELKDQAPILTRDRAIYDKVLVSLLRVEREDSLQRIAALPETERTAFVKNLLHQLLRAQGLKEENSATFYGGTRRDSTGDLFGGNGSGEWYFYNPSTKSSGAQDFQARWGGRPNVDNWRRQSALNNAVSGVIRPTTTEEALAGKKTTEKAQVLTMNALMANLPATPKEVAASNDTIAYNLYLLGGLYKNQVGDNLAAVKDLEKLNQRYPTYQEESTLFNLYACWHMLGDEVKAQYYLDLLHKRHPGGQYINKLTAPTTPVRDSLGDAATGKYKEIYDLFIAGNYDTALIEKHAADSLFGKKYWTPQLMYIQAVYYAHQRQDTQAIRTLNDLVTQFPKDPVAPRATRLKDVLGRRALIESYLTNLKVVRDKVDSLNIDTAAVEPPPPPRNLTDRTDLHMALANRSFPLLKVPEAQSGTMLGRTSLLAGGTLVAGLHSDHYLFDPSTPHLVLVVMTQVANVYATEARNAFARYNSDVHYQDDIPIDTLLLQPGVNILRMGPFKNIVDALAYELELQKSAPKDIVPWLAADKYRFIVISPDNLAVLRTKKNLQEYAAFIDSYLKNMPATH